MGWGRERISKQTLRERQKKSIRFFFMDWVPLKEAFTSMIPTGDSRATLALHHQIVYGKGGSLALPCSLVVCGERWLAACGYNGYKQMVTDLKKDAAHAK